MRMSSLNMQLLKSKSTPLPIFTQPIFCDFEPVLDPEMAAAIVTTANVWDWDAVGNNLDEILQNKTAEQAAEFI